MLVYHGQAQDVSSSGGAVVTAAELAAADIVLTTYDVLRRDVVRQPDAASAEAARSMRFGKRWDGQMLDMHVVCD